MTKRSRKSACVSSRRGATTIASKSCRMLRRKRRSCAALGCKAQRLRNKSRCEHLNRLRHDLKSHRQVADQFAVNLDGCVARCARVCGADEVDAVDLVCHAFGAHRVCEQVKIAEAAVG